ncbi:MAG: ABC-2 family transporter protein [Candidatus Shapirobacteria bacterium]
MRKYVEVVRLTLEEYFTYRLNFLMWRFRNLVLMSTQVFFWAAILATRENFLGYQKNQLLSYALLTGLMRGVVLSSRTADLAGMIRNGDINKLLSIPINLFACFFSRDVADKLLNIALALLEFVLVLKLLGITLIVPTFNQGLVFGLSLVLAVSLFFLVSLFLSLLAFWTEDIWAIRFVFGVVFLEFFSGAFFPLDVLPRWLQTVFNLTPFPSMIFVPLQIWLGKITGVQLIKPLVLSVFWLIAFWGIVKLMWHRGMKKYGAYGG